MKLTSRKFCLPQEFYMNDTETVAKELLGKFLCHKNESGEVVRGRIIETEAYLGIDDPACHSFNNRRTNRTETMYKKGGHSYIYLIYGMHFCVNAVTRDAEVPEAVLIRALDLEGCNGPGRLCKVLGLTKKQNDLPLWSKNSDLWIEEGTRVAEQDIVKTTRIGVDYAGEAAKWKLRFYECGNARVSRK